MPRNCPKTWLSGSRFRNRSGCTKRSYFRYPRISRSSGAMLARTLPWVMTTPLGSAVVPGSENYLQDVVAAERYGRG